MPPQLKILITGFEPFGGETLNPSWEVAKQLDGIKVLGAEVVAVQLPCVFATSLKCLSQALESTSLAWFCHWAKPTGAVIFQLSAWPSMCATPEFLTMQARNP